MNIALCLFALSLLGADGPSNREAPDISYVVRVLKMNSLDWRGAFYSKLQPVASQGGATVWTVGSETAEKLAERDPDGMKAPRVTAASQSVAHIFKRATRKVTSGLNRLADGPFDHATQVAYTPNYEAIREGWAITLSGRKIDQGVLACVVLDETRVTAVHQVALTEHVGAKECCSGEDVCAAGGTKIASRIDVPEVAHSAAEGEWLIPNDGALVVSLGVQTSADDEGKAVVVERLVLIEARPVPVEEVEQASLNPLFPDASGTYHGPASLPAPAVPLPMPMPAMPSRSLPEALDADGSQMALPPLPEDPTTPSSLPGTSEPCASPQTPQRRGESTTLDTASTKADFTPSPKDPEMVARTEANQADRPCLLRIPVNAGGFNVEVEIRAAAPYLRTGKCPGQP